MKKTKIICLFIALLYCGYLQGQDELEGLLDDLEKDGPTIDYAQAAFKSTRVINLQSLERKAYGALEFRIAHRFGPLNGGAYTLFGLDQATIRFSLEYGLTDFLTVGFGRSTYEKTYDFYAKGSLLRQQTGSKNIPVSVLAYTNMAIYGLKWTDQTAANNFTSRLSYVYQLIIGRKFSEEFSFQISPTMIHRNLVSEVVGPGGNGYFGQNNFYAIGAAGRLKITSRLALTAEYVYRIPPPNQDSQLYAPFYDSFSIGVDLETGGHVFQFHLTNSLPMFDRAFMLETAENWGDGGIHFGFNITRDFTLIKNRQ